MKHTLKTLVILLTTGLLLFGCGSKGKEQRETETKSPVEQTTKEESKYPNHVGDIAFDETLDDPTFEPCQAFIPQYYALGAEYRVDNDLLVAHFGTLGASEKNENVYYTIRFIVNCKGKVGRMREEVMNPDYQEAVLDAAFREAVKERLRAFDQWPEGRDFYQYLTFKIAKGTIKEVLP